MTEPSVELALAELTRKIEVGFAKTDGQLALLIQRTQAMEVRADNQAAALDRLDERVDQVEASRPTREEIAEEFKKVREEATEQRRADAESSRRSLMVWALIVTVVVGLLGAGMTGLGFLLR